MLIDRNLRDFYCYFVLQVLDGKGAKYVVETMWMLMESGIEEVRAKNLSLERSEAIYMRIYGATIQK